MNNKEGSSIQRTIRVPRSVLLRTAEACRSSSGRLLDVVINSAVQRGCEESGVPRFVTDPVTLDQISRLVQLDLETRANPLDVKDRASTSGRGNVHRQDGADDRSTNVNAEVGPGVPKRSRRVVRRKR